MSSAFSKRLDFIMSITNTSNANLARALSFDASYISRIRNGKRSMPARESFVDPAATYLVKRIVRPHQREIVEQMVMPRTGSGAASDLTADILANWLVDDSEQAVAHFAEMAENINAARVRWERARSRYNMGERIAQLADTVNSGPDTMHFIGNEGRQQAALAFLASLAKDGKPHTLELYSDEDMAWMTDDEQFLQQWSALMLELVNNGCHVHIIHTLSRSDASLHAAVRMWLPLYLSARVSSYYIPRQESQTSRRSLFLSAPDLAITSSSIGEDCADTAVTLTRNAELVAAYRHEYSCLLDRSEPLVSVVAAEDTADFADQLEQCLLQGKEILIARGTLKQPLADALEEALPARVYQLLAPLLEELQPLHTERLPENVVALMSDETCLTLISLVEPQSVMHVSEHLLAAAFREYLMQ